MKEKRAECLLMVVVAVILLESIPTVRVAVSVALVTVGLETFGATELTVAGG